GLEPRECALAADRDLRGGAAAGRQELGAGAAVALERDRLPRLDARGARRRAREVGDAIEEREERRTEREVADPRRRRHPEREDAAPPEPAAHEERRAVLPLREHLAALRRLGAEGRAPLRREVDEAARRHPEEAGALGIDTRHGGRAPPDDAGHEPGEARA